MSKTCQNCYKEFPSSIMINGKRKILNSRKYCLECSPPGRHNSRPIGYTKVADKEEKYCYRCETTKNEDDFYRRKNNDLTSYCKQCTKNQALERQRALKLLCVEYKGNKCEKCGYDKCIASLEFHHKNPKKKDFGIAQKPSSKFNDKIKAELDKCILVCRNCHGEIHWANSH